MSKYKSISLVVFVLLSLQSLAEVKMKLDEVVWRKYSSSKWVNSYSDTYKYDDLGRMTENVSYVWNSTQNKWDESQKLMNSYTVDGDISGKLFQYFNLKTNQWVDSIQTQYTYNNNSNLVEFIIKSKDATSLGLKNQLKETYTINANGLISQTQNYIWLDDKNEWGQNYKVENTYNSDGDLVLVIDSIWDDLIEIWIPYTKDLYSYSADKKVANYTSLTFSENIKSWENDFKDYTEDYTENGIPKLRYVSYLWDNSKTDWIFNTREFHDLKPDGRLSFFEEDYYNTTLRRWDYNNLEEYTYNTDNNLMLFVDKDKDEPFNRWVNNSKEEMDYTSSVKQNNLVLPYVGLERNLYFQSQLNSITMSEWTKGKSAWVYTQQAQFSYSNFDVKNSTKTLHSSSIKVFPNPSNELLTVNLSDNLGDCSVKLYSLQGGLVLSINAIHATSIKVDNFPNGIYLLSVSNSRGFRENRKVTISH